MGVSNYGPKLLTRVIARLGERGVPLVSNQINYSLLFRKQGAQATADFCQQRGITVLGYYPLANGLLAGDRRICYSVFLAVLVIVIVYPQNRKRQKDILGSPSQRFAAACRVARGILT